MIEYTFRSVVERIRSGEIRPYATSTDYRPGDAVLLISGRQSGPHEFVEAQPDDDPIRAILEVERIEEGPAPYKHFVRWGRVIFAKGTPTYRTEVAFDREGRPRYSRLVAISKRLDETGRSIAVVDLEDGEVLSTDFDRLAASVQPEGDSTTASDA